MRSSGWIVAGCIVAATLFCACRQRVVYHHYEHVGDNGWSKGDSICFGVRPATEAGTCQAEVELRVDRSFPFQGITLIVTQTVYPRGETVSQSIDCTLVDKRGYMKGDGVTYFQYHIPTTDVTLRRGDSLHVSITHNMKRETMPGITDVGVRVVRK